MLLLHRRHCCHMLWTKKAQLHRNSTSSGSVVALCFTMPSFIGTLCEFGLCRDTLFCNPRRPSFPSRLYGCCSGGTVHVICSGLRGHRFTRRRLCRGTVLCDLWRLTNSFCHCCNAGASRVTCSGPRRPGFTIKPFDLVLYCAIPALGQEDDEILGTGNTGARRSTICSTVRRWIPLETLSSELPSTEQLLHSFQ